MRITEKLSLPYRAEVIADTSGWKLHFWFYGPDRRYNPDELTVWPDEIPHFIKAIQDGFAKLQKMRPMLAGSAAEVEETFGYVTTRVGGVHEGVCIGGYRMLCRNTEEFRRVISVLETVSARGSDLVRGIRLADGPGEAPEPMRVRDPAPFKRPPLSQPLSVRSPSNRPPSVFKIEAGDRLPTSEPTRRR